MRCRGGVRTSIMQVPTVFFSTRIFPPFDILLIYLSTYLPTYVSSSIFSQHNYVFDFIGQRFAIPIRFNLSFPLMRTSTSGEMLEPRGWFNILAFNFLGNQIRAWPTSILNIFQSFFIIMKRFFRPKTNNHLPTSIVLVYVKVKASILYLTVQWIRRNGKTVADNLKKPNNNEWWFEEGTRNLFFCKIRVPNHNIWPSTKKHTKGFIINLNFVSTILSIDVYYLSKKKKEKRKHKSTRNLNYKWPAIISV